MLCPYNSKNTQRRVGQLHMHIEADCTAMGLEDGEKIFISAYEPLALLCSI